MDEWVLWLSALRFECPRKEQMMIKAVVDVVALKATASTLNRASAGRLCPINILFMGSAGGAAAL
jgi:hypothetical protein